jgi:glutamate/tyrosine decarboxylase-like PLP-dependent enzyme
MLQKPILICTESPHTHFSIFKAQEIHQLKQLSIKANEDDGTMDERDFRVKLQELKQWDNINIILIINYGSTTRCAFDNVKELLKIYE